MLWDLEESKEMLEYRGNQDRRACRVQLELKVKQDPMVRRVQRGRKGLKVEKDKRGAWETVETKDSVVQKAHSVVMVTLVPKDRLESQVPEESEVQLVTWELKAELDPKELQVALVLV